MIGPNRAPASPPVNVPPNPTVKAAGPVPNEGKTKVPMIAPPIVPINAPMHAPYIAPSS